MDSPWVLPVVTAAAMATVLWTMYTTTTRRADFYDPPSSAAAEPAVAAADPPPSHGKRVRFAAAVGDVGLDDVLEDVKDVAIPVQKTVGALDPVPFTNDETLHIATNILARVNDSPAAAGAAKWDLRLVTIDSVVKVVDPYKTLYYTLTLVAYSPRRNVAFKLVADVVVPVSNAMYVERVRQFSSSGTEDGGPRGSRGPHTEAGHAKWTSLIPPH